MVNTNIATEHTSAAFVLNAIFKAEFKNVTVTGRTPMLEAPQSPSSDGGEKAVQHISLQHEGWPTMVIGWADLPKNKAEVRTWAYLEHVHEQRYPDKRFALNRLEYADFYVALAQFLRSNGMEVGIKDHKPSKKEREAKEKATAKGSKGKGSAAFTLSKPVQIALLVGLLAIFAVAMYLAVS